MKKLMKAIGFTVLMAGVYFLISIIVGAGIGVVLVVKNMLTDTTFDIANVETFIMEGMEDWMIPMLLSINLVTLLVIMLIFLARKDKFISYVNFRKFKRLDAILIGILGVFFNILIVGLVTISAEVLPIQDEMEQYQALMEPLMNSPFILLFLVVSVSAPLFEEILFRGIVLNDFKKAVPVWLAVTIQGILFGVFHMNWIQGVYASVLGIVLGIIYIKYQSIWAPIIMHFTYNTTSFILDYIFGDETSLIFVMLIGLIGSVIMGVILVKAYKPEDYASAIITDIDTSQDEVSEIAEVIE